MNVPPGSPDEAFHCFKGTVKEIHRDEVVLTDAWEESYLEYGASSHPRPPTRQKRDMVQVYLTGVDTIWALPPAKADAAGKPPDLKLPASGPPAAPPPPAAFPSTAGAAGSPPAESRSWPPPLPDTPARFDSPPAAR